MAKGANLDTLPADVLYHIFDDLLKVTEKHCHIAGVTDQGEPTRKPDPTKFERKLLAGSSATEGLTPPPLHASILRVNRQLSATGRRYLYTANRFVLVHVDILGPRDLGEKLLTKYVSKTHLDDFKHHVLEFHCKAEVTASFKGLTHWVGSYLLREQDLHLFLIKLQGLTFVLRADQVYLLPAAPSPMPETPVRFKLRAPVVDWSLVIDIPSQRPFDRNGLSISDQTALHESLLREFKSLAGTTCQVIMNGAASQHVESCNHLNARIVSTDAMGVHLMQVLNEWEQSLADLLPSAHKMPYVQHAYRLLLDVATHNSLTTNGPGETAIVPVFGPGSFEAPDTWELAVRVICLDLFLTCINIEMHAWLEDTNSCLLLGDVVLAMRSFAQGFKPPAEDLCARVYHALAVLPGPMNPLTNDSQELMLHSALMWTPDDLLLQADLEVVLRRKRSPRCPPLNNLNSSIVRRPIRQRTVLSVRSPWSPPEFFDNWSDKRLQQFFNGWTDKRMQLDEATIKMLNEKADARYYGTKKTKSASPYLTSLCEWLGGVSI